MMGRPGDANWLAWTIKIKVAHRQDHPTYIVMTPMDASGQAIQYADDKGDPVSMADYQKDMVDQQQKMMERARKGQTYQGGFTMKYRPASGQNRSIGDEMDVVFAVNPAKVSKFTVIGQRSRYVDITGIRLDPR